MNNKATTFLAPLLMAMLLGACATTPTPTPSSAKHFDPQRLGAISARFQAEIDAGAFPGAYLLLVHDGQVVYEKGLGVRDPKTGAPMTRDTIFRLYSMTKPLTSVAVMQLVEAGRIGLHEPVSRYLPELKGLKVGIEKRVGDGPRLELVDAEREINIQDLLTHTSGISYSGTRTLVMMQYEEAKAGINDVRDNGDMVAKIARLPLMFHPGSGFEYGMSTDVLGAMLERISGKPLDQYLAETILVPLKMHDSGFWVEPRNHGRMAEPFEKDPEGKPIKLIDRRSKPTMLGGGGGMVSTPHDYQRFLQMLLNGGELDGVRILGLATVEFMASNHLTGQKLPTNEFIWAGHGFGLGFMVRTDRGKARFNGSVGDYQWYGLGGTSFWVDPQERLIGLVVVQRQGRAGAYNRLFRDMAYGAMRK